MPSLPVPGRWHGFPVSPAFVAWRIEDTAARIVVGTRVARDVRQTVPKNDRFWGTFARGTHQNWPVFDGRKQRGMTGRYLFKLSTRPFDTGSLRDGRYFVVVTVQDTAGNRAAAPGRLHRGQRLERILSAVADAASMNEAADPNALIDEIARYLAVVDAFRAADCEPTWRPELSVAIEPEGEPRSSRIEKSAH